MLYNGSFTLAQMNAFYLGTLDIPDSERLRLGKALEAQRMLAGLWATQIMIIEDRAHPPGRSSVRDVSIENLRIEYGVVLFSMNYTRRFTNTETGGVTYTTGSTHDLSINYIVNLHAQGLNRLEAWETLQLEQQQFMNQLAANIAVGATLALFKFAVLPKTLIAAGAVFIAEQAVKSIVAWNNLISEMDEATHYIFSSYFYTGMRLGTPEGSSVATAGLFSPNAHMLMKALETGGGGLLGLLHENISGDHDRINAIRGALDGATQGEFPLGYLLVNGNFPLMVEDENGNTVFNAGEFEAAMDELADILYNTGEHPHLIWQEILTNGGLR
jgi:hypothetical protein